MTALFVGCASGTDTVEGKPEGKVVREGNGYRYDSNGWIYLHIEGEPFERGFQHGRFFA
jgi:hypothetical protein